MPFSLNQVLDNLIDISYFVAAKKGISVAIASDLLKDKNPTPDGARFPLFSRSSFFEWHK